MCVCALFSVCGQCGWPQMTALQRSKIWNPVASHEKPRGTVKHCSPTALKLVSTINWPTSMVNVTLNTSHILCCFKYNGVILSSAGTRLQIGCTECGVIRASHGHAQTLIYLRMQTPQVNLVGTYKGHGQKERREAHSEKDDNMQLDSERAKSWEQSNASLRVQTPSAQVTCICNSCLTIDVVAINHEQTTVCAENADSAYSER